MSVPSNRVRHHGSTPPPPPSSVTPAPQGGIKGVYRATRPIPGRIFGAAVLFSTKKRTDTNNVLPKKELTAITRDDSLEPTRQKTRRRKLQPTASPEGSSQFA